MGLSNATAQLLVSASEAVTNPGGGSDTHGTSFSKYYTLANGTGPGNAQKVGDRLFQATVGGVSVDLTAFAGGINGVNINFSLVKWIVLENQDATNAVTVAFNGTNGWTNLISGTITLQPGEVRIFIDSNVGKVVDGTHKVITFTSVAGTPNVQIRIAGEGA
jgi:hypothetical protein